MLQRDYLMKMVEMLVTVLTKVTVHRENKNYGEALKEIESAAKTIAGLDIEMVKILKADDLIKLMKTSDIFAGRCLISAELLFEYGKILEEKGSPGYYDIYNKSFRLYTEALLTREIPDPGKYYPNTESAIKKLSEAGFFDDDKSENIMTLFEYYNASGKYSKAEDLLFNIIESGEIDKTVFKKRAVGFYKDMLELDDGQLSSGNFSKEEAEEGLKEILDMIRSN
ncbi:MAG: hypothetical protein JSS91_07435 [Bacteroidetes bacterium]|nr:hypothetical protein [Bacteroidota bacterium]